MPHITYEYTVPRVSSTPASSTQEQPPLASMMGNGSYSQLPITGNEVEARNGKSKEEKKQSAPPDPKGNMEARGDVQWEHQAPCNLSKKPEVLRITVSGVVLRNKLGKQDGFGESRISLCRKLVKVMLNMKIYFHSEVLDKSVLCLVTWAYCKWK